MKSFQNKETKIRNADESGKILGNCRYSDLINICLRQPKQGGNDWVDVENKSQIAKVIVTNPETIELEDSYFTYLKKLVETMRWSFWDEDLLTFKADILNVK